MLWRWQYFSSHKTTSPLFGKRLSEMRHGRAVYISVRHHSSLKVYLPLGFVKYLITQPIWLGVSWAQYEKFVHKVSIKEKIYDGMDTNHVFSYKRDTNWKHQNPNSTRPRNTKYDLRHHLKPNCKETYKHWIFESLSLFHGTPTYTFRKSQGRVMELIRSNYVPIPGSSWQFSWNKYDDLTTSSQWILVIAIVNFQYRFLSVIFVDWLIFHSFSLRLQFDEIVCNQNNTGNE